MGFSDGNGNGEANVNLNPVTYFSDVPGGAPSITSMTAFI
jgi:hypothetical protein